MISKRIYYNITDIQYLSLHIRVLHYLLFDKRRIIQTKSFRLKNILLLNICMQMARNPNLYVNVHSCNYMFVLNDLLYLYLYIVRMFSINDLTNITELNLYNVFKTGSLCVPVNNGLRYPVFI